MSAAETPVDHYWQALRADLSGQSDEAVNRLGKLVTKVPASAVAANRLFEIAIQTGDLKNALKAARLQQLGNKSDPDSPLLFFADSWQRGDWAGAKAAVADLKERQNFAFLEPILMAWINVVQGKPAGLTTAMMRDDPMLGFYALDQLVYLDLATGDLNSAKQRLTRFQFYHEDFGRSLGLVASTWIAAGGDGSFANSMRQHVGGQFEAPKIVSISKRQKADAALAGLFSHLSDQLEQQKAPQQALYFARLAKWVSPVSPVGSMTLANRLNAIGKFSESDALYLSIPIASIFGPWAVREHALSLKERSMGKAALQRVTSAQTLVPRSTDLALLSAQLKEDGGDHAGAMAQYQKVIADSDAINASPRQRAIYRILIAQLLDRQGNWDDAAKHLEAALLIDGQNPQLLNYLGYSLLERRKDVKRGFELVSRAHALAPNSPEIADSLGWGHFLNGDGAQAIPLLEMAVQGAGNDVTINEHLGDVYWSTGRKIDARYAWRAASLQAKEFDETRILSKLDRGLNASNAAP